MSVPTAPKKARSPNYPVIGLEEAIQRLKAIYEKQQRYPASRDTFAKLMGYGGLHGASATVVSALSKYGLLEGHGDTLRVSEMGQDLILHRKGDPEYTEALRTAAFMPAFFREMREQYPYGLPSEHSLRASLIKRGFSPKAIDPAVRAYRDTIEFVDAETEGYDTEESVDTHNEMAMQTQPMGIAASYDSVSIADPGKRTVALPYSVTEWATLQAAFPLSEAVWQQMITVLEAMKPALVALPEQRPSPGSLESILTADRLDDQDNQEPGNE
jgi:hypothetical protein